MRILKILVGSLILLVLVVAGSLGYVLVRFPTRSQLRKAVGTSLVYNRAIATDLSHNAKAFGIVSPAFPKQGEGRETPVLAPIADVVILSPKRVEKEGHGVARITGLAIAEGNALQLLPKAPAFTGTISFDYRFHWDDNGRANVWRCDISNISVVEPASR